MMGLMSSLSVTLVAVTVVVEATSSTGRCGAGGGYLRCDSVESWLNRCCSQASWCGDSEAHCGAGCQSGFGLCWGAGSTPSPPAGGGLGRPKLGNVPYGTTINSCTQWRTVALTFDDGPFDFTNQLLDLLARKGVKATFMITGNNREKGAIDSVDRWQALIRRAYNEGHQIASHTWDHPYLDRLSEDDRRWQMTRLETALTSIIGRYPTYMRPPYSECDWGCRATMDALGYHVVNWDLDTDDYNNNAPDRIWVSRQQFLDAMAQYRNSYLPIAHDPSYQTVANLVEFMIDSAVARGYRMVRLGECLGDPEINWYRT